MELLTIKVIIAIAVQIISQTKVAQIFTLRNLRIVFIERISPQELLRWSNQVSHVFFRRNKITQNKKQIILVLSKFQMLLILNDKRY